MTMYRKRAEQIEAMQVTAQNIADAATFCGGTVMSDGRLGVPTGGDPVPVEMGVYVTRDGSAYTAEQFAAAFVVADGPSLAVAFGSASVPGALAAGATKDIDVTLSREMPSTTYQAAAGVTSASAALLGTVLPQGVISRTKTVATVRVKNTGAAALISPAITVSVIAVDSLE